MDQIKIGNFIKTLRKGKDLTQDQLAEEFNVARRTVSRWETGKNLPDISILIEMSDFFAVDLRELLDGERKSEEMKEEIKETVLKVAELSNEEKQKINKRMHWLFIVGLIAGITHLVLVFTENEKNFVGGLCMGITVGMMVVGVVMTSKYAYKMKAIKTRLLRR